MIPHKLSVPFVSIGLAVIVILLWLPSGFRGGDIQEHWHIRNFVGTGTTSYDSVEESYFPELALTRPIARLLYWIPFFISPNTFRADNLQAMLIIWGKGLALYILIARLFPVHRVFAFLLSVVFILYPGNSLGLSLRIPHIHMSILSALIAINYLLSYWNTSRHRYLVGMWVATAISGLAYEAIYPILFLVPFILLTLESRFSYRFVRVTILWWIIPVLTVLYSFILLVVLSFGFQSDIVSDITSPQSYINTVISQYRLLFVYSWTEALAIYRFKLDIFLRFISTFIGVFTILWALIFHARNQQPSNRAISVRPAIALLITSIIIVVAGYVILSFTSRASLSRALIISMLGSTLLYSLTAYQACFVIFKTWGMYLFILGMGFAVMLGSAYYLVNRQELVEIGVEQAEFFEQVFEQVPDLRRNHVIYVVFDQRSWYFIEGLQYPHLFTSALHNIFAQSDKVEFAFFCNVEANCMNSIDGIMTSYNDESNPYYAYENMLIFEIDENGVVHLIETLPAHEAYQPDLIIDSDASSPERLKTLFAR